jgi:polygalacturonase
VGRTCISYPLVLPSNTNLTIPAGTTLKAGPSDRWPHSSATHALPFLTAPENTTNLTITGKGTIDGSGAQWWTGLSKSPGRPHLLTLPHASNVLLENFLMLNAADFNAELHGEHYRVFGIRIRGPDYNHAPNTDGIDVQGSDFIIRGVDVQNGDDSICIKSPSWDVLVEDSIVRQGNGLVIGTGGHTNITNITFRNCTAQGTVFGCHIKFKEGQKGKPGVSNITFEDINIIEPTKYAIGINQNGQGRRRLLELENSQLTGSDVPINNITYRRVRAKLKGKKGGVFTCNPGDRLTCRGINFEDVDLGDGAECTFENVFGKGTDVRPKSCAPPTDDRISTGNE